MKAKPFQLTNNQQLIRHIEAARRNLDEAVGETTDLQCVLNTTLEVMLKVIGCPNGNGLIRLTDTAGQEFILAASRVSRSPGIPPEVIRIADDWIASTAVNDRKPKISNNFKEECPEVKKSKAGTPEGDFLRSIGSLIAAPLIEQEQIMGVIVAYKREKNGFPKEKLPASRFCILFRESANAAAAHLFKAMLNESNRLLGIPTYLQGIRERVSNEKQLLEGVLDYALQLAGASGGHISVLDKSPNWLVQKAVASEVLSDLPERQKAVIGVDGRSVRTNQTQLVTKPHQDRDFQEFLSYLSDVDQARFKEIAEILAVPLWVRNQPYGVISLHTLKATTFQAIQMNAINRLAHYTAQAIGQMQYQQERTILHRLVGGMTADEILQRLLAGRNDTVPSDLLENISGAELLAIIKRILTGNTDDTDPPDPSNAAQPFGASRLGQAFHTLSSIAFAIIDNPEDKNPVGTGFFTRNGGGCVGLTAWHVIKEVIDSTGKFYIFYREKVHQAQLIRESCIYDTAILEVIEPEVDVNHQIKISPRDWLPGDDALGVGYHNQFLTRGLNPINFKIDSNRPLREVYFSPQQCFECMVLAPAGLDEVAPGASGGPVYNTRTRCIIGIILAGQRQIVDRVIGLSGHTAYAIPFETLFRSWPELRQWIDSDE